MLDTTQLLAAGGFAAWPKNPIHVSTPFGDGQLIYLLFDRCGVRLIGQHEISEFQLAAVKVVRS